MVVARSVVPFAFVGVAAAMIFLWFPYSPLQDLPEWIYQGCVFNGLWTGHASADFFVKPYPVPYAFSQLWISAALIFFNPMLTSKLIVAAYGALSLIAARRIIEKYKMDRGLAWPVLIAIFVLNGPFWDGYIGYQFGLVIFSFYLSLDFGARTDAKVLVLFSILTYFSHGIIFFSFALAAAAFSLKERRLLVFVPAMLPSTLLVMWYVLKNVQSHVGGPAVMLSNIATAVEYKIYTFMKLGPYHNFVIFGADDAARFGSIPVILGTIANLAFLGSFLLFLSARVRQDWPKRGRTPEFLVGVALICIAVVLPPTALGVGNPGERLLYTAFLLLSTVAFGTNQVLIPGGFARFAGFGVSTALVAGFALSSVGLIAAGMAYGRMVRTARIERTAPAADIRERTVFAHRLVQFDDRMKETEREWRAGEVLSLPLVFDTALLGEHHAPLSP